MAPPTLRTACAQRSFREASVLRLAARPLSILRNRPQCQAGLQMPTRGFRLDLGPSVEYDCWHIVDVSLAASAGRVMSVSQEGSVWMNSNRCQCAERSCVFGFQERHGLEQTPWCAPAFTRVYIPVSVGEVQVARFPATRGRSKVARTKEAGVSGRWCKGTPCGTIAHVAGDLCSSSSLLRLSHLVAMRFGGEEEDVSTATA